MSGDERLWLRVAGGDAAPVELPSSGVLVIGSSPDRAGLVLDGQGVADVHCAIGLVKGGGWAVKDMGSEFGTLLNGESVRSARLQRGDVLFVGSKRLSVVAKDELAESAAPAPKPEPASQPAAPVRETPPPELSETQRAPLLGGYRIERTLGRGAMGKVFLAVQESLDRQVALKVLAPHLGKDSAFVERFQKEARAAASLTHPNVVIVHDVGEQKGFHYLSMEYMDRGSLEELLAERGRLSYREVLEILRDAASGLVYAESRGIVHQDIKPANLMRNHQGATKIADLGLAVSVEAESDQQLEGQGGRKVFGTPHFISPEQLRGETVDARSDLYSLGATVFQLVTGETLFSGANTREILRGHLLEPARDVRDVVSDVPAEFAELVARLVQKAPADRYPSAGALLADVQRLLARELGGVPVASSSGGGGLKWVAGLVGVLALGGAAWFLLGGDDADANGTGPGEVVEAGGNGEGTPPDGGTNLGATGVDDDPAPDVASGEGEDPNDGSTPDDRDLRIFELEADRAFLRLAQEDLTDERRIARLREVAARFDGTDAAREAREQADALERATAQEAAVRAALNTRRAEALAALRALAELESPAPEPARTLAALDAYAPPAELTGDELLTAERTLLVRRVIERALEFVAAKKEAATAAAVRGDRNDFLAQLGALVTAADVPVVEGETPPPGVETLRAEAAAARAQMESVDAVLAEHAAARAARASLQLADSFGGEQGLEGELARMDLEAARARLETTLQGLQAPAARRVVEALRDEVAAARAVLVHLGTSYDRWRRKTVDDPRTGKPATATGATPEGLQIEGSFVPFAAFGANTEALSSLFEGRFDADYTPEQRRGILALLRISAALEVVHDASEMFYPQEGAQFTPREAEELTRGYAFVREWLQTEPDAARRTELAREQEAAELLAHVLRSADEENWSTAVAGLERLLAEFGSTLVVLLMSDGSS